MKMDTEQDYQRFYQKARRLPGQIERTAEKLERLMGEAKAMGGVPVPTINAVNQCWERTMAMARAEGQARAEREAHDG